MCVCVSGRERERERNRWNWRKRREACFTRLIFDQETRSTIAPQSISPKLLTDRWQCLNFRGQLSVQYSRKRVNLKLWRHLICRFNHDSKAWRIAETTSPRLCTYPSVSTVAWGSITFSWGNLWWQRFYGSITNIPPPPGATHAYRPRKREI